MSNDLYQTEMYVNGVRFEDGDVLVFDFIEHRAYVRRGKHT